MKINTKVTLFPAHLEENENKIVGDCMNTIQNIMEEMENERVVALYDCDNREITIELLRDVAETLDILANVESAYISLKR